MLVTSVAVTSDVATLGVQVVEGNIPAEGSLISVRGTQTASGAANVSNIALASVTINSTTGAGTVTFDLSHADIATDSTPAAAGEALVPVPVVFESLPGDAAAGLAFSVQSGSNASNNQRGITWWTQFTGSPDTVAMNLQGADVDEDSAYTTVDSSTATGGESRSVGDISYSFYRIQAASTGGTDPTFAAGLKVM